MLIRISHAINPSTRTLEELLAIRIRATSVRHIGPLLYGSSLSNLIDPLLQSRELGNINFQGAGTAANPRVVGDIGNRVL